jgi:hypothetical protein
MTLVHQFAAEEREPSLVRILRRDKGELNHSLHAPQKNGLLIIGPLSFHNGHTRWRFSRSRKPYP